MSISLAQTRRGDTLIEVLIAIAVFSLVAILSITAMNLGVTNAETSLELATARAEINAQAEALRFLHSSYISENTLPKLTDLTSAEIARHEKYQQYAEVWRKISENAISATDFTLADNSPSCDGRDSADVAEYQAALRANRAFVLNVRNLLLGNPADTGNTSQIYVSILTQPNVFQPSPYNARIIYVNDSDKLQIDTGDGNNNYGSDDWTVGEGDIYTDPAERLYQNVALAEGIWVVAVKSSELNPAGDGPRFYDFYIQSCWYGSGAKKNSTTLDTVLRLYNPSEAR